MRDCTCYVKALEVEVQFGLRYGAHGLDCIKYHESLDPVERLEDELSRIRAANVIDTRCEYCRIHDRTDCLVAGLA
jgi:hypothetical protein